MTGRYGMICIMALALPGCSEVGDALSSNEFDRETAKSLIDETLIPSDQFIDIGRDRFECLIEIGAITANIFGAKITPFGSSYISDIEYTSYNGKSRILFAFPVGFTDVDITGIASQGEDDKGPKRVEFNAFYDFSELPADVDELRYASQVESCLRSIPKPPELVAGATLYDDGWRISYRFPTRDFVPM